MTTFLQGRNFWIQIEPFAVSAKVTVGLNSGPSLEFSLDYRQMAILSGILDRLVSLMKDGKL